ncbi:MAG TPA: YihY/virulence factor BrkB family protein [Fimbriimonadaceae bacterium]|nr:YihY/virulence factor BrkB family protein [Fimbriimonadaceae bacterium]
MTVEQLKPVFLDTFRRFGEDRATSIAASLAFYAMLSISPVLVLAVLITGMVLGEESARTALLEQVQDMIGRQGAEFIESLLVNQTLNQNGFWPALLSIGVILFGASALFVQLRDAVHVIWGEAPSRSGVLAMVVQRLVAGVMVVVFGLVVLAWLGLETFLAYWKPGGVGSSIWPVVTVLISVCFFTFVAAAWMKYLVPERLSWGDVWPGGLVVAVLFTLGKVILALYFALAKVSAAYGSAGAIVILLLWIYYNAQIFFLGLEFVQSLALDRRRLHPERKRKIDEKSERRREEQAA